MKRNVGLKPRESGNLPPEKLADILNKIYPEKQTEEILEQLGFTVCKHTGEITEKEKTDG